MKGIHFLIIILISFVACRNQKKEFVTKETEINFAENSKRGIEIQDTIFMVEKDLKTVSAYYQNKYIWKNKIVSDSLNSKNFIGEPKIRYMKFNRDKNSIFVVYGKHSFAELSTKKGKIINAGSD